MDNVLFEKRITLHTTIIILEILVIPKVAYEYEICHGRLVERQLCGLRVFFWPHAGLGRPDFCSGLVLTTSAWIIWYDSPSTGTPFSYRQGRHDS